MSVHPTLSFEDETQRAIYEYVECHGAVSPDELARSIRIDRGPAQSKPARSGTYSEAVPLSPDELRASVEKLKDAGYLVETDGKLRISLSATPTEHELADGAVTIRPAREEDREGLIEVMRSVGSEGTYVVAENVVEQLEREPALVRANDERSRVFFVAVFEPESDQDGEEESPVADEELVGWLHVDAPELPSLCHTAELTVGVTADYRREGIGSALLEYGLEWAGDGYRKVYQSVPATNEQAIEFLEANGWKREGEREEHYRIDEEFVDEVLFAIWP